MKRASLVLFLGLLTVLSVYGFYRVWLRQARRQHLERIRAENAALVPINFQHLPWPLPPDKARLDYAQGFEQAYRQQTEPVCPGLSHGPLPLACQETVARWVETNAAALQVAREVIELQVELPVSDLLKLLQWNLRHDLSANNSTNVLQTFALLPLLARNTASTLELSSLREHACVLELTAQIAASAANAPRLDPAVLPQLAESLAQAAQPDLLRRWFGWVQSHATDFSDSEWRDLIANASWARLNGPLALRELNEVVLYNQLAQLSAQHQSLHGLLRVTADLEQDIDRLPRVIVLPQFLRQYLPDLHAHVRAQAALALARSGLAAASHQRQHGRWPRSWADLVPADLPVVPVDPFTNQPFRLKSDPDGCLLYSPGPDAQDNSGNGDDLALQLATPHP